MAKAKGLYAKVAHDPIFHKTSIGRNPSLCKMNKHKRRQFKKYQGQGRQGVDSNPFISYIYRMKETNRKKKTMQETITKYQSKFDRLMTSIEKDKILKKMPGNATAGIAVQMIKSLKSYLKANKA